MSQSVRRATPKTPPEEVTPVVSLVEESTRTECFVYGQELDNGVSCLETVLKLLDHLPEKHLWTILGDPEFQLLCTHQQRIGRKMLERIEQISNVAKLLENRMS